MTAPHEAKPVRFRPHRGGLAESIAEQISLSGMDGLRRHLAAVIPDVDPMRWTVEPYSGADPRCGWANTHIVHAEGYGVAGFCECAE